jgi:transcriptional regulator with XRE-family HTH domain
MRIHEKLARLTKDLKKTMVCKRAGIPNNAISNYISKEQMPSADVAFRLAKALAVDVAWLVDDRQNWPPMRVTGRRVVERYLEPTAA